MMNDGQTHGYSGILPYLPPQIGAALEKLPLKIKNGLEEIRLRISRPVFISGLGQVTSLEDEKGENYICSESDLKIAVHRITQGSVYALAEEFRRGYIPLPGGHRVGIGGRVILNNSEIETLRDISSLNFRIAKEIKGCGKNLLPFLESHGVFQNTLIFSPPCCGKTTLLRDLTRLLSDGEGTCCPRNITLIDQRSEIAGCFFGQPRLDVGRATDVLDGAPKSQGMIMAIRALSPEIIVTDEIGDRDDEGAILEVVNSGVSLLLSAHAKDWQEITSRPMVENLLNLGVFKRLVQLSNRDRVGRIENIFNGDGVKL